jgi:hypothetical protein
MTERWQRELKKLTSLEMPEDVRERMERGAGLNSLPPRRQRVAAAVVAFAVFAAASAFAFQALRNRGPAANVGGSHGSVVAIDLRAGKVAPTATLSFMGSTRQGHASFTCWSATPQPQAGCSVSHWSQFEAKDFVTVPPDAQLAVAGDAQAVRTSIESWGPSSSSYTGGLPQSIGGYDKTLVFVSDLGDLKTPVPLNLKPGIYQLDISGRWPQGEQEFSFAIQIVPGMTVDLRAATVASTASLTVSGFTWQGFGGSTCWQQRPGVEGCIDVVAPHFATKDFISIPSNAELVTRGDAQTVSGVVLGGRSLLTYHRLVMAMNGSPGSLNVPLDLATLHTVSNLGVLASPVQLDLAPGVYVLSITGTWPQGTREFYFMMWIDALLSPPSPVLGCPFASQQPVAASTSVGTTPQVVLRGWAGYRPGDRFRLATGVPDSWWVERSGVLVAWLRLGSPPASTDPTELAIIDGQMCSRGP